MRKCKFKQWLMCEHTETELWKMFCDEVSNSSDSRIKEMMSGYDYNNPKLSNDEIFNKYKENHKKYRAELTFFGYFVDYGLDIEEYDNGGCSFTCAIVEDEHGKLHKVSVDTIEFLPDDYHTEGYRSHELIFGW